MAQHAPADLRNIAFLGATGVGKSTLIEAVLHNLGAIARRGSVADGSSSVDYDAEEKEKKHTLFLKMFQGTDKQHIFNLLDTPGYPDFIGEALQALGAVELVAVCINAQHPIPFHTRKIWDEIGKSHRGRMIVVTHMDSENVDTEAVLAEIREVFGNSALAANYPLGAGANLSGVVDVLDGADKAPDDVKEQILLIRQQLVETLVTQDESVMEEYLETGTVSDSVLINLVKEGIATNSVFPVLFVATTKDIGVKKLEHFIAVYAPSPMRGPYFETEDGDRFSPKEHTEFSARVFKTVSDPFVGRLTFLRVMSGEIKADDHYLNVRTGKVEKMHHIARHHGKEHVNLDFAQTGDIVALTKVESLETNDSICAEKALVKFASMAMPSPMVARAIYPHNRNDETKMVTALKKVLAEDATLTLEHDSQTGEQVLHGVSELHLQTVLKRVATRYKVEIDTKIPRIPLRETMMKKADGHFRHKKQSGGRGQFAEVYLRVEPTERGTGFEFEDATFGGSVPKQYIPSIERGILEQMAKGVVAGYPVVDVKVSVYDGKYHDVDSDEHSFRRAGARAFRDAFEKAGPVLLEPIVDLEVAVHNRFMGDITGDLNGRRGRISGMDAVGDFQVIKAFVPLKEVQTYAADLRSLTQGEGSFTHQFDHYDIVPSNVAQEFIKLHEAELKEDDD